MLEEWGPFLTYPVVALGIFFASFAALFWSDGYIKWLILTGKDIPSWLVKSLDEPNKPFSKVVEEGTKFYQMYTMKGIAWCINLFWIGWFLSQSGCGTWVDYACHSIFGNVALLDIGAITFELALFFVLTGLYRWYVWRK
ncbi:MAG: hypothetical protein GY796_28735 [Chloroflexi bacterium]|nr:hypothetical protein [Chloroflexota bacterium]